MAAQIDEEKQTFIDLGKEEDNILFDVVKQKRTRMLGSFFIVGMIVATALCLSFFVIWAAEESDSDSPDHNGTTSSTLFSSNARSICWALEGLLKVPTAAISTESEECSIIGKTVPLRLTTPSLPILDGVNASSHLCSPALYGMYCCRSCKRKEAMPLMLPLRAVCALVSYITSLQASGVAECCCASPNLLFPSSH